ncbi:Flavin-containing monooxygenase FMO GS-OX-like 1 [Habropoda laboriosa]|uniref:Flavin-containing monooxygenase n=1 Tax=Habropoda laboriosa TaxID=597456 RepID=A0A0L7RBR9_9HYME|nr:Flavin-containing monooxygenase FMO GS-OX-like 1 [Habropoda laboriosa]
MKIAVIGAGSAGLAALRHSTSDIFDNEVICYERTAQVGGTWVYTEESGVDQYGLPIHTSMYKSLRTNLPKEVMGYPDYPIPDVPECFIYRTQILDFLNSYCDHFQIRQYIRFLHNVELVKPIDGDRKWLVRVKDLRKNIVTVESFDAVMVCNGHFSNPNIPEIKGQDIFQGQQLHSHDYRVPEVFSDKTVVIVGAGPSGFDLVLEIVKTAKKTIFSHHIQAENGIPFPANIIQKPDVKELTERSVLFEDSSSESIDAIFYCVRFVLQLWSGKKKFPSKEDMLKDENEELKSRTNEGVPKKYFHVIKDRQHVYLEDLAKIANIKTFPPVISNIFVDCYTRVFNNILEYRNAKYKILDEHNFVRLI